MRIAIVSDVHAYELTDPRPSTAPSYLCVSDPADQPTRHPVAGLKQLITNEGLQADLLVCPGDLADKANTAALAYVWNELHNLKGLMGASKIIATAGNHDVDSRHKYNDFDAKGALQALTPLFPGLSDAECDRYWARNFVLLEEAEWRLLLLNSSAYHGGGKEQLKEAEHGRVSQRTISAIEASLKSSSVRDINILVCHHHLYKDNAIYENDYSEMDGADHLLRVLGSGDYGQWLVVHGHKHHPKLQYGSGSSSSPVIFGAGSLCASLYSELAARARNQFYLLEVDANAAKLHNLDIAGRLTAWDWIPNAGFKPAGSGSGLPHNSGFGYRAGISSIASAIAAQFTPTIPYLRWRELLNIFPQFHYLLPSDVGTVMKQLKVTHSIRCTEDAHGLPLELARP
jgi:3',5'-cyclic AMP phosphodiesterase CpdA